MAPVALVATAWAVPAWAAPAGDSPSAAPASVVAPASASDDPLRAKARALAYAGVEAFAVQDYRAAHEKLEESFRLLPVPSLGLWSARTLVKLGKLVDAERRYRDVIVMAVAPSDPPVQARAKIDAARELDELTPKLPSLAFKLDGARPEDLQVEVDGAVLPRTELARRQRVDPGRHVVVGIRGTDRQVVIVNLAEGEQQDVWLKFAPTDALTPAAAASGATTSGGMRLSGANDAPGGGTARALRTAGWLSLAAGGVGAAAGVVAYFVGRSDQAEVERRNACGTPDCASSVTEAYSTYETWRTLHVVGLLSGGLLGAAGVTLIIAGHAPSDAEGAGSVQLGLSMGPGSAALVGRF